MSKKYARPLRWLTVGAIVIVVTLGFGYLYFRTSIVFVENKSEVGISKIRIEIGSETFWSGALPPGESHREFGFVTPDDTGNLVISYEANGVMHEHTFPSQLFARGIYQRLEITRALEVHCEWQGVACADAFAPLKLNAESR